MGFTLETGKRHLGRLQGVRDDTLVYAVACCPGERHLGKIIGFSDNKLLLTGGFTCAQTSSSSSSAGINGRRYLSRRIGYKDGYSLWSPTTCDRNTATSCCDPMPGLLLRGTLTAPTDPSGPILADCSVCTGGASEHFTFTVAGVTNNQCSDCNNVNGTHIVDWFSGCNWRSGTLTLCGQTRRWQFEYVRSFDVAGIIGEIWELSIGIDGDAQTGYTGQGAVYRAYVFDWNCQSKITLRLNTVKSGCFTWPKTITLTPTSTAGGGGGGGGTPGSSSSGAAGCTGYVCFVGTGEFWQSTTTVGGRILTLRCAGSSAGGWLITDGVTEYYADVAESTCSPFSIVFYLGTIGTCGPTKLVITDDPTFCTSSSSTNSTSSGGGNTVCCPDVTIPNTLTLTVTNLSGCPCIDGFILTLNKVPGQNRWTGGPKITPCGGLVATASLQCDTLTGLWSLSYFNCGVSGTATVLQSASCNPFELVFSPISTTGCCPVVSNFLFTITA